MDPGAPSEGRCVSAQGGRTCQVSDPGPRDSSDRNGAERVRVVVHVHGHLFVGKENNAVCGRLPGAKDLVHCATEIERDLMVRPAHARIGDSAPCAPDRPMEMTEKEVPNARSVRGQQGVEGVAIGKPDVVHA